MSGLDLVIGVLFSLLFVFRAQQAPALRSRWTWSGPSVLRALGFGLVAGSLAQLGAGLRAGIVWGLFASAAAWLYGGRYTDPANVSTATTPGELLERDRRTFWGFVRAGTLLGGAMNALAVAVSVGFADSAPGGGPVHGVLADVLIGAVLGFAAGVWQGAALALAMAFHRTAWGMFTLTRLWLAARHGLPRDLMPFLADAHETHGVLRRVGPVHQFRHIELQRHLAAHRN